MMIMTPEQIVNSVLGGKRVVTIEDKNKLVKLIRRALANTNPQRNTPKLANGLWSCPTCGEAYSDYLRAEGCCEPDPLMECKECHQSFNLSDCGEPLACPVCDSPRVNRKENQ